MNRKTNKEYSNVALNTAFYHCNDLDQFCDELYLIAVNDPRLHGDLVKNRRVKIHSIAFGAILEGAKWHLASGYYISGDHVKKWILQNFSVDYKTALVSVCERLQVKRNEFLN